MSGWRHRGIAGHSIVPRISQTTRPARIASPLQPFGRDRNQHQICQGKMAALIRQP